MKKHIVSFCAVVLFFPVTAGAVYFARDTVTLFENGNRVSDDLTLWAADYGYGGLCMGGVCDIGQQFYPVTIYRLKSEKVQGFGEFQRTHDSKQGVEFHRYIKENSYYQTTLQPPKSEGGEGCGYKGCIGGRIGDDRTIDLDLKTNKFRITSDLPTKNGTTNDTVRELFVLAGLLVVCGVGLFVYKFKKSKNIKQQF